MQDNVAAINWPVARRAMLTQPELCPDNAQANCLDVYISPGQLDVACRCIKSFYKGLRWADEFGIKGGYIGNRKFQQVFLIDDSYILGVFDNRNVTDRQLIKYLDNPADLGQLIDLHKRGQGNIKTLIVLEKANLRLANSEEKGRQSQFLVDVVYPAILGIQAKFLGRSRQSDKYEHQKQFLQCLQSDKLPDDGEGSLLTSSLIVDAYRNPDKANTVLMEYSPLNLFFTVNSPLNRDFEDSQAFFLDSR